MAIIDVVDLVDDAPNQLVVRFPESGEADLTPGFRFCDHCGAPVVRT